MSDFDFGVVINPATILFEDEHLCVISKPAGINTHAPAPFAGEGIYETLRDHEVRWANLAIIHRLDKETSGLMVFGKSTPANRSLTEQFATRRVEKSYLLLTDRTVPKSKLAVTSYLKRTGDKYGSAKEGERAETHFQVREQTPDWTLVEARPLTGRTHQIRVHASESGFPILGDVLYAGTDAPRLFLHAEKLGFQHPVTKRKLNFESPAQFGVDPRLELRKALIDPMQTNAYRLINGAADGWPEWYVDRYGSYLLSQSAKPLINEQKNVLRDLLNHAPGCRGAYHKVLLRKVRAEASPEHVLGETAPERFPVKEAGLTFEVSFGEGYSTGLFLDQRDNRRRFLTNFIAPGFPAFADRRSVLNTFAYTCSFSLAAAKGGAHVTSLDLSRKYLDWGKANFQNNGVDATGHEFIYGDVFDWLRRFSKKGRTWDVVILDPPTFSHSRESGVFQAQRDYGKLLSEALLVLAPQGVILASTNAAEWKPAEFVRAVDQIVVSKRGGISHKYYGPQPVDFPMTRAEPGYLKTYWVRVKN